MDALPIALYWHIAYGLSHHPFGSRITFGSCSIGIGDWCLRTRLDAHAVSRHIDSPGDATRNGDSTFDRHCRSDSCRYGHSAAALAATATHPRTADARTDR